MRKEQKEIIKLTAKEIFKTIFELPIRVTIGFEGSKGRKSLEDFYAERSCDRENFRQKVNYLKTQGLINIFLENNKRFAEITPKGLENLKQARFDDLAVRRAKKWDGKFRIVIFDVPEDKKLHRDGIRRKLDQIGFKQIQKSVFAYPFECKEEIEFISGWYNANRYIKYMIAEIIEGEDEIIRHFLENKVLRKTDLSVTSPSKFSPKFSPKSFAKK